MTNHPSLLFPKLPFNEQLLIWSARKWVQSRGQGTGLHETLRTAFQLARAPEAHIALDAFLTILFATNMRAIEMYPPEAVTVTSAELRLSALVATLQVDEDEDRAFALLGHWLPAAAQRHGILHCNILAQELLAAGHQFSRHERVDEKPGRQEAERHSASESSTHG